MCTDTVIFTLHANLVTGSRLAGMRRTLTGDESPPLGLQDLNSSAKAPGLGRLQDILY